MKRTVTTHLAALTFDDSEPPTLQTDVTIDWHEDGVTGPPAPLGGLLKRLLDGDAAEVLDVLEAAGYPLQETRP